MNRYIYTLIAFALFSGCNEQSEYVERINTILEHKNCRYGEFTEGQFEKVFEVIRSNTATLDYDFSEVSHMEVVTSDDSNLRAYTLERYGFSGEPSLGFETSTLIQYRIDGKVYTTYFPESHCVIKEIRNLSDNKYLFVTFWGCIVQGEYNHNKAKVYSVDDEDMIPVMAVFETNGNRTDEIEVDWESGVVCYEGEDIKEEILDGILYDHTNKTLYVAKTVVISGIQKVMSGAFLRYKWDGLEFKDVTLMKPYEVRNEDYYIRIEQSKDGKCIYCCWNNGMKSGLPDLIIKNGIRQLWSETSLSDYDRWISLYEGTPLGEKYTFKNNGYTYEYITDWNMGRLYDDLAVCSPDGDLLYFGKFQTVCRGINYRWKRTII